MSRILIVDDDVELTELLTEFLVLEGFSVRALHHGTAELPADFESDLIVLDVMLPGLSGFEVLKRVRTGSDIPIIMLTARDSDVDRVVGLEIGADDYVPKPVNPRELVARIRAVLRRTAPRAVAPGGEVVVGEVRLNAAARRAWCNETRLELTSAEFDLLEHFLLNVGRVLSRDELSAAAFSRHLAEGVDRNVDTLVSKVRRKLGPTRDLDQRIKTVRNAGYIYALPPTLPGGREQFSKLD